MSELLPDKRLKVTLFAEINGLLVKPLGFLIVEREIDFGQRIEHE